MANVSNIVTAGNYRSSHGEKLPLTNTTTTEQTLTVEQRIQQLKSLSLYLYSHDLEARLTADYLVGILKQVDYYPRAALFFRYGMDLDVGTVARDKFHGKVSVQTIYRYLKSGLEQAREIMEKEGNV